MTINRMLIDGPGRHDLDYSQLKIQTHQLDETDFAVETNLYELIGLRHVDQDPIIERALLAVGGLERRIEDMATYTALTGFHQDELPLFQGKLAFLTAQLTPEAQERSFNRVRAIAGLPDVTPNTRVDIHRLLEIRESDECLAFRQWLHGIDEATDDEIANHVASLQVRIGAALTRASTRAVRFLTVTGIGLLPGVTQGVALSLAATDALLVERLFRTSGPATFISSLYPRIITDE